MWNAQEDFAGWAKACGAKDGDLICIFAGKNDHFQTSEKMGALRHLMGTRFGLRSEGFEALWVVDFPLLEWDEEGQRYHAMHHPFTSPKAEDAHLLEKGEDGNFDPVKIGKVRPWRLPGFSRDRAVAATHPTHPGGHSVPRTTIAPGARAGQSKLVVTGGCCPAVRPRKATENGPGDVGAIGSARW